MLKYNEHTRSAGYHWTDIIIRQQAALWCLTMLMFIIAGRFLANYDYQKMFKVSRPSLNWLEWQNGFFRCGTSFCTKMLLYKIHSRSFCGKMKKALLFITGWNGRLLMFFSFASCTGGEASMFCGCRLRGKLCLSSPYITPVHNTSGVIDFSARWDPLAVFNFCTIKAWSQAIFLTK
jgi:hypothetical protein